LIAASGISIATDRETLSWTGGTLPTTIDGTNPCVDACRSYISEVNGVIGCGNCIVESIDLKKVSGDTATSLAGKGDISSRGDASCGENAKIGTLYS